MECKKCQSEMFIDEWGGWIWTCVGCDYTGPFATKQEIEDMESKCAREAAAELAENQEPLGADLEQILFDNRWKLYESEEIK